VTGNPLVGNFYGTDETNDPWAIHWSEADCGYGVAQVTDGMVKAGKERDRDAPALPADKQRAVALDYATNIAAGLQILARKWNQLQAAGITINDNDPSKLENWFAAVWAYNTGVNPQAITGNTRGCTPSPSCTDAPGNGPGGNWGLGWGNNPANPDYPPDRHPFLVDDQEDARHPQDWSYPEKVMGFAASPIVKYDFRTDTYEGAYLQGWWISVIARDTGVRPPLETFCRSGPDGNNCVFDDVGDRASCALGNFHCWWHWPATWKADCQQFCGHENLRYGPGAPEPPDGTHYPPVCDGAGLPGGSLIVDDQPDTVPIVRTPCGGTQSHGTFKLQFVATGQPGPLLYPGKVDLHQIGSGLDGHFWFTHAWTRQDADLTSLEVRGTWALDHDLNQWARVWVHLPSHGAHSQQATYVVDRGSNASPAATQFKRRTLLQNVQQNKWVPLGVFQFAGRPKVTLTNVTRNDSAHPEKQADGTEDVAYDAVAFQPLTAKPRNFVVSLGDSYSSGEGASEDEAVDYDTETNTNGGDSLQNGCHRSRNSWARRGVLGDNSSQTIGQRESTGDANLDFHLIACSGAQTENLLPTTGNDPATNQPWRNEWGELGTGAYREGAQLDRGYLDENTTLVTFSIGGNDLKWGDAIRDCVLTPYLYPCWEASIDGERAADYVPRLMHQKYPPSLLTVLRAIKQQAPNAKILVMGYPELISDGGSCLRADPDPGHPAGYLDMSVEEAEWSNQLARDLAVTEGDTIALARDQGINVRFADPILNRDFYGEDGGGESVCGDPETIHGIIWAHTKGEKPGALPSKQSFHPKVSGTANYAKTYNRELRNWGL